MAKVVVTTHRPIYTQLYYYRILYILTQALNRFFASLVGWFVVQLLDQTS